MDDLISRQVTMEAFYQYPNVKWTSLDVMEKINEVPSAQFELKRGKWVKMTGMMPPEYFGHYECSECGWHLSHHDKTKENELGFCPNCGAIMDGDDGYKNG